MPARRALSMVSAAPGRGSGSQSRGTSRTISSSIACGSPSRHGPSTVRKTSSARRPVNSPATSSSKGQPLAANHASNPAR